MSLVDLKPQTPAGGDEIYAVLADDGRCDPSSEPAIPEADLLKLYRSLLLTRLFDLRMFTLQRQGRLGFYLACTGEEAAVLGAVYPLREGDWVFPCYREPGAAFWRGATPRMMADQCFGNAEDLTKGRQMPVHYAFKAFNYASVSSPIATQIPHAVGAAWGAKIKGTQDVALAYFGDGATSHPDFHNGMNMAGVLKAPAILLCRNNGYAISTPCAKQTASKSFAIKGKAYGVEGVRVDGNDLLAMIAVTRRAVDKARSGGGATLIEAVTYRIGSHSTSDDPSVYRDAAEVTAWEPKDPLRRFRLYLEGKGLWNEAKETGLQAELKAEIDAAVQAAESVGPPQAETLFDDVFATLPPHLQLQKQELMTHLQQESR